MSRRAIRNMNTLYVGISWLPSQTLSWGPFGPSSGPDTCSAILTSYPDATPEELQAMDNVCIICREEMVTGAKRLPCNHIFHTRWEPVWGTCILAQAAGDLLTTACSSSQLPALLVPATADLPYVPYGCPACIIASPVTTTPGAC